MWRARQCPFGVRTSLQAPQPPCLQNSRSTHDGRTPAERRHGDTAVAAEVPPSVRVYSDLLVAPVGPPCGTTALHHFMNNNQPSLCVPVGEWDTFGTTCKTLAATTGLVES